MKLFLSSYRAGNHEDKLLNLLGNTKKMATITNSKDYKSPAEREARIKENSEYWQSVGLESVEIDLRPYFNKTGAEGLLDGHDFVWLAGGNVFLLRRALSYTGLDQFLSKKIRNNEIILGGESAGAIIMGPTLKHSEVDTYEDSPNFVPDPYQKETIWEGLRLVDYVPVPHYKTPGYIGIDEYIEKLEKEKIPYKKMTDDQAITIDGDKTEFLK